MYDICVCMCIDKNILLLKASGPFSLKWFSVSICHIYDPSYLQNVVIITNTQRGVAMEWVM